MGCSFIEEAMKATLKFNLPEEQREFSNAASAQLMASSMWDIQAAVRAALKHGEPSIERYRKALEEIREIASEYE